MTNPADSSVQNLLPVQAYFNTDGSFNTFIGQGVPFYATANPIQSGLTITNSTLNSSVIGGTSPASAYFTSGYVSVAPTTATGIANKQYVDYFAAGLSWKQPVKAASLSNIASLSGFQTVDTVPLTDGDRVLVKDQSLSKDNGIYVVRSGAWEYAVGADDWAEYVGAIVFVEEGSQAYSAWYSLAQEGGTLGVTALDWANFSVSSTYSAGTGLSLAAGVFSITNTGVINATYGSASKTVTLAINAQGQATSASQQDIAIAGSQITSGTVGSSYLSGSYSGITGLGTLGDLTVTNPISGSVTGSSASTTNLLGGGAGSLPYQTATNTTGFLAASTDGYILSLALGVPAWIPNTTGTVTSVTASSPLASSGGSTPDISISQATTSTSGYLSSTDWNTFNGKAGAGANSDITSMTGITGGISSPDYIQFDTGATVTRATARLWWDSSDSIQTLNLGMAGSNATLQIGEETYFRIKCQSAITEGQVVMFAGTVGASGGLIGAPATGLTADTASYVMGVATESGATNDWIYVTAFGLVRGIDTTGGAEAWVDGQILYYNPAVTGGLTKTLPSAPNAKVQVCAVVHADANGSLFIRPSFGGALGQYEGDVQVTTPANGDLLIRNQTSGKWVNAPLTAGTGISITNTAGAVTIANTSTPSITITDDTTTNATRYITFTSATSGSITGENVSSTKLQYNPSTGALSATSFSGAVTPASVSDQANTSTGYFGLPAGTTAQRPVSPASGYTRFNTTLNAMEVYSTSTGFWEVLTTFTTVPNAPTIGTATAISSTSATVTYTASGSGTAATSFTAVASPGGQTGTVVQSGSGTITVSGLTTGTAYTFTVYATNAAGNSASSSASNSITTWSVPGAPTIGTATTTGNTTATVAYTAPASNGGTAITSYTAVSSPGGITATLSQAGSGTINVTGLTGGTSYTFVVYATNAVGNSANSSASNSITTTNKTTSVDYAVVAGGGGGGRGRGGGGGAGGMQSSSLAVSSGSAITVTVGGGGAQYSTGSNSVFSSVTSNGGGLGGSEPGQGGPQAGGTGGSGGGTAYQNSTRASGTSGQGNAGGQAMNAGNYGGGGGGGKSANGQDDQGGDCGAGGAGASVSSALGGGTYAGGGGGGGNGGTPGAGGSGGGGTGSTTAGGAGGAGTANTGGGGGGGAGTASRGNGGAGGSGIVIIAYSNTFDDAVSTTGSPSYVNTGGYKRYTWTSSGSITF